MLGSMWVAVKAGASGEAAVLPTRESGVGYCRERLQNLSVQGDFLPPDQRGYWKVLLKVERRALLFRVVAAVFGSWWGMEYIHEPPLRGSTYIRHCGLVNRSCTYVAEHTLRLAKNA